jgi:hypothetical protein
MRPDSVLQIIAFLRRNLGRPVSIWEVCQGIALSYQPTYVHIRRLEAWGVVSTERQGRRVCCALDRSDAAALWLALESEQRGRAMEGAWRRLGEALRSDLTRTLRGKLLAVAMGPAAAGALQPLWVLVAEPSAQRQAEEVSRRVGERLRQPLQVAVGTSDDLLRWLQEEPQRQALVQEAVPIYGRERFWEMVLAGMPASQPLPRSVPPSPPQPEDDFID